MGPIGTIGIPVALYVSSCAHPNLLRCLELTTSQVKLSESPILGGGFRMFQMFLLSPGSLGFHDPI